MAGASTDAAGTMGYEAFREIALARGLRPSSPDLEEALLHQQIDALFDGGDVDGDGLLSRSELIDVLELLGLRNDERRNKVRCFGHVLLPLASAVRPPGLLSSRLRALR